MNELVLIKDDTPITTSLIIAEAFAKEHKDVLRAIENLGCSQEFGRRNFAPSNYLNKQNKTMPMYEITRDGFAYLAMGFTGSKAASWKEKYIAAFNEMETALRNKAEERFSIEVLGDPAAMRGLLLTYTEKVLTLEAVVEEQAPKVAALDRIAIADGATCVTNAAKTLQVRPKDLFGWLSAHKWIYRRVGGKGWVAYQDRLQQGVLSHKITTVETSDGHGKVIESVLVTPKGLTVLAKNLSARAA